jgi:hypothetical protein
MNSKTLKALKESIAHYDRMIAGNVESIQANACALCQRFLAGKCSTGNERCPVRKAHGKGDCRSSPWWNLNLHCRAWHDKEGRPTAPHCHDCITFLKDERKFLKSLLPR